MGDLQGKANQLEKAIQETAFEGIQERREYAIGMRLIKVASDVARISDSLEEIEQAGSEDVEASEDEPPASEGIELSEADPPGSDGVETTEEALPGSEGVETAEEALPSSEGIETIGPAQPKKVDWGRNPTE